MTDEELNKIRECLEFQMLAENNIGHKTEYSNVLKREINLYNEIIRLRDIIAKATDKIYCRDEKLDSNFQKEMLKILEVEYDKNLQIIKSGKKTAKKQQK